MKNENNPKLSIKIFLTHGNKKRWPGMNRALYTTSIIVYDIMVIKKRI